jgi:hypothetical protein
MSFNENEVNELKIWPLTDFVVVILKWVIHRQALLMWVASVGGKRGW